MKNLRFALLVLFGVVLLLAIGSGLLLERVPPAAIGVRQNLLGGGITQRDFDAGYYLGVAGVHRWHLLDGRVHFVSFARDTQERPAFGSNVDHSGALDIRTSDNNTASLDVTVLYQILEGRAWRIVQDGQTLAYRDRVRQAIQGTLREELSKLSPEDFVNTDRRLERVAETLPLLRRTLDSYHVEPLEILIRAVRFPPEYEEKLQLKQLTRQKSLLAQAREREERQQQTTQAIGTETEALEKRVRGEWDKRLQEARSDNQVEIAGIRAAAEIESRTERADAEADRVALVAAGQLALDQAEALRDQLRNAALDTVGGRILLARTAAANLQLPSVTLNSNDPEVPTVLDLDQLVELLIGTRGE
jgi:regulator of protease activity HflC (stomatin/prohibitin superfamily)